MPIENQPKFEYYNNLSQFFSKYNFNELEPFQAGFGTFCLTDHQTIYMFYYPEGRHVVAGDMPELKGKTVNQNWFSPLNGNFFSKGKTTINGNWLGFDRPDEVKSGTAILILEIGN